MQTSKHLKKLTCKGTLRQVLICPRSPPPSSPVTPDPPPHTLYTCILLLYTYSHREEGGRANQREGQRSMRIEQPFLKIVLLAAYFNNLQEQKSNKYSGYFLKLPFSPLQSLFRSVNKQRRHCFFHDLLPYYFPVGAAEGPLRQPQQVRPPLHRQGHQRAKIHDHLQGKNFHLFNQVIETGLFRFFLNQASLYIYSYD